MNLWQLGQAWLRRVGDSPLLSRWSWKFYDPLQNEGWRGTLRRAQRLVRPTDAIKLSDAVRRLAAGARPILSFPGLDFDVALFQRPQQMALALAAEGRTVLYGALWQSVGHHGLQQKAEHLWVVEDLVACATAFADATLMVASTAPSQVTLERVRAAARRGNVIVYDFLDELDAGVHDISPQILARHRALLAEADIVVCTASRLEDQARAAGARRILSSPNAADLDHWRAPAEPAAELRSLPPDAVVVGYYGALAGWFDFALVGELARARPAQHIVLIGPDYDRTLEKHDLAQLPNVHVLGPRPYAELPAYLARFDVAIIPFVKSQVTEATSPVKLFEYMAGECPVVTTDLRECRKYPEVAVAADAREFIAAVDAAAARRHDPVARQALRARAAANSWRERAQSLLAAIDVELARRAPKPR